MIRVAVGETKMVKWLSIEENYMNERKMNDIDKKKMSVGDYGGSLRGVQ